MKSSFFFLLIKPLLTLELRFIGIVIRSRWLNIEQPTQRRTDTFQNRGLILCIVMFLPDMKIFYPAILIQLIVNLAVTELPVDF
jgi:hypothetical protein